MQSGRTCRLVIENADATIVKIDAIFENAGCALGLFRPATFKMFQINLSLQFAHNYHQ